MPNINDFTEQCDALGLQHIEIVPDGTPGVDDSDIHSWQDVLTKEKITTSTYELYEEDLKKTEVVFFCQDENLRSVSFLANAVFFTERGGSDESWTYKTKTINIPVNGGLRTFSEAMNDELIASGIIGIVADSLCDKDTHGDYLSNSLYGKIEDKLAQLMADERKTNLAGVKVPWLYNTVVLNERYNSAPYSRLHPTFTNYTPYDSGKRSQLSADSSDNGTRAKVVKISPYNFSSGKYIYSYRWYDLTNAINSPLSYFTEALQGIITNNPKTASSHTVNTATVYTPRMYNYSYYSTSAAASILHSDSIEGNQGSGFGGYMTTRNARVSKAHSGTWAYQNLVTIFPEQPYLVGFVFFITDIRTDDPASLGGYLISIGINKNGHIIEPVCPYTAGITTVAGDEDETSYNVIDGVTYWKYTPIPYSVLEEHPEYIETYQIGVYNEGSPISPLRGAIALENSIRMTPEEAAYAGNLNYLIAPNEFIPDDYFDDEE